MQTSCYPPFSWSSSSNFEVITNSDLDTWPNTLTSSTINEINFTKWRKKWFVHSNSEFSWKRTFKAGTQKIHDRYLGENIQNELINLLANKVKNIIVNYVRESKYFSAILDCTPHKSHNESKAFPFFGVIQRIYVIFNASTPKWEILLNFTSEAAFRQSMGKQGGECQSYKITLKDIAESLQIEPKFGEKRIDKIGKQFDYEGDDMVGRAQPSEEKYKIDFFCPVIDTVLKSLKKGYTGQKTENAMKNLEKGLSVNINGECSKDIVASDLLTEIKVFRETVPEDVKTPMLILKYLNDIGNSFPNICLATEFC
ncbi:uncharacterized protein LOC124795646 [Schistocerca piceifrons]|uniref:uncharacterized protein LOC124795646 n=1 Tax=Schistocerca piceifrons TaxID=274613 RepID=UPI001F5EBFCA|nr:uncharacterized protein LOC124795646 [Schistocerca piceifrons]